MALYTCPKCGEDVTLEVLRKQAAVTMNIRMETMDQRADRVVVKCSNGHTARY